MGMTSDPVLFCVVWCVCWFVVTAMKRVEEVKQRRQAKFIKNR